MLLAVTPNAAIDRTAVVDALRFDTVLRPVDLLALPGGKGINVARVAHRLGAAVATTGFAGGHAGRWLVEQLETEGLQPRFVEIAAETRTTYTTTDTERSVIVSEHGPAITAAEADRLLDLVDDTMAGGDRPDSGAADRPAALGRLIVALCGSMPRGAIDGLAARLVARCRSRGATSIVDTTGATLREAVGARPDVVKVNASEAAEAGYGTNDTNNPHWQDAAGELAAALRAAGARTAIVTAGARGAVCVADAGAWAVQPPEVDVVSAVGSGDAFTAGIAVGIERGRPLPEGLAIAAAAGAANAARAGAGLLDPDLCMRLLTGVRVTAL